MDENLNDPVKKTDPGDRPLFAHPQWMVGIVLIFGVLSILAGLSDPIWLLLGAPCIIALALFIISRIVTRNRK
jgi:hypothetical protein